MPGVEVSTSLFSHHFRVRKVLVEAAAAAAGEGGEVGEGGGAAATGSRSSSGNAFLIKFLTLAVSVENLAG